MDVLREWRPRAAREHKCAECQTTIDIGEQHIAQASVDGGQFWTYRAHGDCFEWAREIGLTDEYGAALLCDDPAATLEGAPASVLARFGRLGW